MASKLTIGLGLKPRHFRAALECTAPGIWFEVHAENYMVQGGPRLAWLEEIGARHPLSLHGVALSLGADAPPDPGHLRQLRALAERLQPALVSEHLAWSRWRGVYFPDLLPVPRTTAALQRIADNIDATQAALGRPIAIENPSHYLQLDAHEWDEIEFLESLCQRTGCRLLADVNNVYVSARNLGFDADAYIDRLPAALVSEIHVAGHSTEHDAGPALLVDSHDAPVADEVWDLYARLVRRIGPRPCLIERDGKVPDFAELLSERERALAVADPVAEV